MSSPPSPKKKISKEQQLLVSDDEISRDKVEEAWGLADSTISTSPNVLGSSQHKERRGWKTVRIFVSSTFNDFQNERKLLVNKIFPDLRIKCEKQKVRIYDIDLRWGVPKDSTSEDTIRTCLEEIEKCKEENEMAFFLNMSSERHGWIPLGDDVPPEMRDEYEWIESFSVTEMEIMQGAYREQNPNALFLIRDPDFIQVKYAQKLDPKFVDTRPYSTNKLQKLKQKIMDRYGPTGQVKHYQVELEADGETFKRSSLNKNFTPLVMDYFEERINKQYPLMEARMDPWVKIKDDHQSFMQYYCGKRLIGRDDLVKQVVSYVQSDGTVSPFILTEKAGMGKTAVMALCAEKLSEMLNPSKLVYHFVSAVPNSNDQLQLIHRLLLCLGKPENELPRSLVSACSQMEVALSVPPNEKFVFIIDAADQLLETNEVRLPLQWIPSILPPNIRLVLSIEKDTQVFQAIQETRPGWKFTLLPTLNVEDRKSIVQHDLIQFKKRLDVSQTNAIFEHSEASENLLWLEKSCEKLRQMSNFETINWHIAGLGDDLHSLNLQNLERLEEREAGTYFIAALCLLECTHAGLLEEELLELLVGPKIDALPPSLRRKDTFKSKTRSDLRRLPAKTWADTYRLLKPFLRPFGDAAEGKLSIYHQSFRQAVRYRYFESHTGQSGQLEAFFHKKLTTYFAQIDHTSVKFERKLEEYPYQLVALGDLVGLKEFLGSDDVFEALYDEEFSASLAFFWNKVEDMRLKFPGEDPMKAMTDFYEDKITDMLSPGWQTRFTNQPTVDTASAVLKYANLMHQNGLFSFALEILGGLSLQCQNLKAVSDKIRKQIVKVIEEFPDEIPTERLQSLMAFEVKQLADDEVKTLRKKLHTEIEASRSEKIREILNSVKFEEILTELSTQQDELLYARALTIKCRSLEGDEATELLKKARSIFEKLSNTEGLCKVEILTAENDPEKLKDVRDRCSKNKLTSSRILCNTLLGKHFDSLGEIAEAFDCYREAFTESHGKSSREILNSQLYGEFANDVKSTLTPLQKDLRQDIEWADRKLKFFEELASPNSKEQTGFELFWSKKDTSLFKIAASQRGVPNFLSSEEAENMRAPNFDRAIAFYKKCANFRQVTGFCRQKASYFARMGRHRDQVSCFKEAITFIENISARDLNWEDVILADFFEKVARHYEDSALFVKATEFYSKSLAIYRQRNAIEKYPSACRMSVKLNSHPFIGVLKTQRAEVPKIHHTKSSADKEVYGTRQSGSYPSNAANYIDSLIGLLSNQEELPEMYTEEPLRKEICELCDKFIRFNVENEDFKTAVEFMIRKADALSVEDPARPLCYMEAYDFCGTKFSNVHAETKSLAELYTTLGFTHQNLNQAPAAFACLEKAVELNSEIYGEYHPETVRLATIISSPSVKTQVRALGKLVPLERQTIRKIQEAREQLDVLDRKLPPCCKSDEELYRETLAGLLKAFDSLPDNGIPGFISGQEAKNEKSQRLANSDVFVELNKIAKSRGLPTPTEKRRRAIEETLSKESAAKTIEHLRVRFSIYQHEQNPSVRNKTKQAIVEFCRAFEAFHSEAGGLKEPSIHLEFLAFQCEVVEKKERKAVLKKALEIIARNPDLQETEDAVKIERYASEGHSSAIASTFSSCFGGTSRHEEDDS